MSQKTQKRYSPMGESESESEKGKSSSAGGTPTLKKGESSTAGKFERPRTFGLGAILAAEKRGPLLRPSLQQLYSESSELRKRKAAAKSAWEFLEERKKDVESFYSDLCDPTKVTFLPYPGISDPGDRPGCELHFVGSPHVHTVYSALAYDVKKGMMITGARGVGKSCTMRAFAWLAHATLNEVGGKLICIWNLALACKDLLEVLKQELLFTYFLDTDTCRSIEEIVDIDAVKHLLQTRCDQGEKFLFLLDSAQALDAQYWSKKPRLDDANLLMESRRVLAGITRPYEVIWILTPTSERVEEYGHQYIEGVGMLSLDKGFSEEAMKSFMSRSIFGFLVENRKQDVSYYAGAHPLLLNLLEDCCALVAVKKLGVHQCADMTKADVASRLSGDEDWENILNAFVEHKDISRIKASVEKTLHLREGVSYHTIRSMISLDARYALNEEEYCSPFIKQLYMEVFREKEHLLLLKPCGPWVDYCKFILSDLYVNWSELGWLVERLCADVISRLGIHISARLTIEGLKLIPFSTIPQVSLNMSRGRGLLFCSVKPNYSHVDAVIFYRDTDGELHFVALQFTTSVENHMHSADAFMSYEVLRKWIPDEGIDKCTLHFAFICLTDKDPTVKQANIKPLRGSKRVGNPQHHLHIVSFTRALKDRVGTEVLSVLQQMVEKRECSYL